MNIVQFFIVFAIAATVTAGLTPLARRFALKMGLVDVPNPRRINKVPMPTGGGLAILQVCWLPRLQQIFPILV